MIGVRIDLDRRRRLRFTLESIRRLEEETGVTLEELGREAAGGAGSAVVVATWAGLIDEDPGLTIPEVREMVERCDAKALANALNKAVKRFDTKLKRKARRRSR